MTLALLAAARTLADHPAIGHRRTDLTDRDLRFWPVRGYLLVYVDHPAPIRVARILHGARDIATALSDPT